MASTSARALRASSSPGFWDRSFGVGDKPDYRGRERRSLFRRGSGWRGGLRGRHGQRLFAFSRRWVTPGSPAVDQRQPRRRQIDSDHSSGHCTCRARQADLDHRCGSPPSGRSQTFEPRRPDSRMASRGDAIGRRAQRDVASRWRVSLVLSARGEFFGEENERLGRIAQAFGLDEASPGVRSLTVVPAARAS